MTTQQTIEKYMIQTMLFSIVFLIATVMVSLFVSLYKISTVDHKIDVLDKKIDTIVTALSGAVGAKIVEMEF